MQKTKARPFLKWAGGKGQLLNQFKNYYPYELIKNKINRYAEPFVGGGAVFFDIMQNYKIEKAYISDINADLILAYKVIQQNPSELCNVLAGFSQNYLTKTDTERKDYFLQVRNLFNLPVTADIYNTINHQSVLRTAQLIFLNKTCFNGLFRQNSKGAFNVPHGRYTNPTILDKENIFAVSELLQNVEIKNANYTACYQFLTPQSFVYFDPPYKPISKTASFTAYTANSFADTEQVELSDFFKKTDNEINCKLMLSNSDLQNENKNDLFFETIFNNYNIYRVTASRAINSKAEKRGKITEIVITNYATV